MPSTDTKPELTAKASMAQPVSQPAVYASGLNAKYEPYLKHTSGQVCTDTASFVILSTSDSQKVLFFILAHIISFGLYRHW
jgi:hypothetical protein